MDLLGHYRCTYVAHIVHENTQIRYALKLTHSTLLVLKFTFPAYRSNYTEVAGAAENYCVGPRQV